MKLQNNVLIERQNESSGGYENQDQGQIYVDQAKKENMKKEIIEMFLVDMEILLLIVKISLKQAMFLRVKERYRWHNQVQIQIICVGIQEISNKMILAFVMAYLALYKDMSVVIKEYVYEIICKYSQQA